jgi:serine/threonine-protein kinase
VAVDAACNVVVADGLDKDHSRVVILPTGATSQIELPFTGLNRPTGVALDTEGNVYVTDTGNNRVLELPAAAVGSAISAIRAARPVEVSSACS